MKIFALLSLLALSIAHAQVQRTHCEENDFMLNFVELKNKMSSYEGPDLKLLQDTYWGGRNGWNNAGFIKRIYQAYDESGLGHGCETFDTTSIRVFETEYRMFVGDSDYDCDGGNKSGIILNWSKIEKRLDVGPVPLKHDSYLIKDFVVAVIGDENLVCPLSAGSANVDTLLNTEGV